MNQPQLLSWMPSFGVLLPTRGSVMLDLLFLTMFGVVIALGLSVGIVKFRGRYELHKKIQVFLATALLLAVVAFEIDIRCFTDWRALARPSPYYATGAVNIAILIHVLFAIPTFFLWLFVVVHALRTFPRPARPGPRSRIHVFWARLAAVAMLLTAVSGWVFYWLAFVA